MITIYSTQFCRHCIEAKRRLKELGIPYDEIDVNFETIEYLKTKTDQMSLPVILFNDEVVSLDEVIKCYEQENRPEC